MSSIIEACDREMFCFIDGLWSMYRVNHGPGDDIRIYAGQVKSWFSLFHKLPRSCLSASVGDVIARDGAIPCDSLLSGRLDGCQIAGIYPPSRH